MELMKERIPGAQCLGSQSFTAGGPGFDSCWELKILQASWCSLKQERIEQKYNNQMILKAPSLYQLKLFHTL